MKAKQKILVIEDDNMLLKNIFEILNEEGYEVFLANNGSAGFQQAQKTLPDLIICDISMPEMNGYEVLKALQNLPTTRHIPFIFLTAKVGREDIRKGMQLGADDYIFKPFNIDDLINSVNLRLQKRKSLNDDTGAETNKNYSEDENIFLKFGRNFQFVSVRDIKYLCASTPYIKLKTKAGRTTLIRDSLNEWEKKLPSKLFLRIHRNTIVNINYINKMEKISSTSYIIRLQDESETFVISKRYSSKIKRSI